MNKKMLKGWKDVFSFTFSQTLKGKGFYASTVGIGILLIGILVAIHVAVAVSGKSDQEPSKVSTVHIVNNSDLTQVDFSDFSLIVGDKYKKVSIQVEEKTTKELLKELSDEKGTDLVVEITNEKDTYYLNGMIPVESVLKKKDARGLLDQLTILLQKNKISSTSIEPEKLTVLLAPVQIQIAKVGEENQSDGEIIVKMILPMIISFFLYMMAMAYGQSISKAMIAEKNSKIIELLLTSIKPYAIILGKMLAMVSVALLQMFIWIGCIFIGLFAGDYVGKQIDSEFNNVIFGTFKMLRDSGAKNAFTVETVVLAVIILMVGFIFICSIAGLVGAASSKPEDLAVNMTYFTMPVLIGFFAAYFMPMAGAAPSVVKLLTFIPVTAPFLAPSELLVGNMNMLEAGLVLLVLLISCGVLVYFAGKTYRNKVFYNNTKSKGFKLFSKEA